MATTAQQTATSATMTAAAAGTAMTTDERHHKHNENGDCEKKSGMICSRLTNYYNGANVCYEDHSENDNDHHGKGSSPYKRKSLAEH